MIHVGIYAKKPGKEGLMKMQMMYGTPQIVERDRMCIGHEKEHMFVGGG